MGRSSRGAVIGTNLTGTAIIANGGDGIFLDGAGAATIGGSAAGQGNVISGNAGNGVHITGSSGSVLEANTIGTDAAGASALPNGGYGDFP